MLKLALIAVYIVLCVFSKHSVSAENNITFDVSDIKKASVEGSLFLLLPIPKQGVPLNSNFFLSDNKVPIKASFKALNTWPTIKNEQFIRLLSIEVSALQPSAKALTLNWEGADTALSVQQINAIESNVSQLVYPSKPWLVQSILLHPYKAVDSDWYTEPQKKYAHYFTNQALLTKKGYPAHKAAQWLYDRPQAIYQLYLMSGEKEWLTKANELADFYINNIDESGMFMLKKNFDPKYLMPKGLLYRYLLTGDVEAIKALKRIYERSLDWDESYTLRRGFWTERNQAAALNVAVSYWEVSNDEAALRRINDIIDATVAMTFNPGNDWSLRGCPQHSFKSHEGWGDDTPACSPWMMALLGDALWRFYQLTGDVRAASLIDAFGDFVLNYGIYYGNARVKNIVIPKYIVSINNPKQEELNQWTDPQHACDVGALLGKSAYIKQKNNRDNFLVKTLFNALLEQCAGNYTRLKKAQNSKRKANHWVLKPPRRFGWMYSTTSDLPWLKSQLLNDY
ncbi:hypothetical protein [Cognaticolwellia beringensis]|uniref:Uncharacterized protein n=1 Tax=Cognaticolwellia beringensis TaxID=1967665 RepID=A0A222G8Q6_9GAMM|nr:hypothetical protein [Cognaticolwellia beringensis]ASP47993.1 hypothetical protein B5D82_09620 [Cognaticolwellia beringensis]